jgi:hypothetical protein
MQRHTRGYLGLQPPAGHARADKWHKRNHVNWTLIDLRTRDVDGQYTLLAGEALPRRSWVFSIP